ncbi:MAG: uncharacterized protein JWO12_3427 [Frankiales bacterium]|nr:uncharacterized protein [Frankiales bacterium]
MIPERTRLVQARTGEQAWKHWGPYVSLRQWGTVREDYSPDGDAWNAFPFDQAVSRAYRWGEDGIAAICDRWQHLCFGLSLWNGRDPILKERLFGLTNGEGNHGEDVKEHWWPLESTPTHSYMSWLYRYPQAEYPYEQLRAESRRRTRQDDEYELVDTGVLAEDRFFDVETAYAKSGPDDLCIRITVTNQGPERAALHLLPTVWFRNTWAWGRDDRHPAMEAYDDTTVAMHHSTLGDMWLSCGQQPTLLFTENETNSQKLFGAPNRAPFVKDGINDHVLHGLPTVNPARTGTKASAWYTRDLAPGEVWTVELRLSADEPLSTPFGKSFDKTFLTRKAECDELYATLLPDSTPAALVEVHRRAMAGLLWTKQYYAYQVDVWLEGDPAFPPPDPGRGAIRNGDWKHLGNTDVISMPDAWEYPWYAAWDLAFHMIPMAQIDPDFAKEQLILLCREWYMHPNGQLPAYEWALDDTNPPVHAWAAYRVFKIDAKLTGTKDYAFLERIFHKLLMNFTWWVNRKDAQGRNVFAGGFLGLDNIGLFDRSKPLPGGAHLDQADGTSWMAMYALNMLGIALELAAHDQTYEDVATKFFEHFVGIAHALTTLDLWDAEDGFFYDVLRGAGEAKPLKVRSAVGLIPLFAIEIAEPELFEMLPDFARRVGWFQRHRPELCTNIFIDDHGRRMLSVLSPERLRSVLGYLLDEDEFLSPHGIRSLSRFHRDHPVTLELGGELHSVDYEPAESRSALFGGNSNWRGPLWFPINYLVVESLQRFHRYLGDDWTVAFPTGAAVQLHLWDVAGELSRRLISLFVPDETGHRAVNSGYPELHRGPLWEGHVTFPEYLHGDTGAGLGASHQTGWTALVAKLISQSGATDGD